MTALLSWATASPTGMPTCQHRMSLRRHAHALDQRHRFGDRELLAFRVVWKRRQALLHEFDAAAVEQRPITCHRYQHRPTPVIRDADDAALRRHDVWLNAGDYNLSGF